MDISEFNLEEEDPELTAWLESDAPEQTAAFKAILEEGLRVMNTDPEYTVEEVEAMLTQLFAEAAENRAGRTNEDDQDQTADHHQ